jgi:hypothetical protein
MSRNWKMGLHQIKIFCTAKEITAIVKRKPTELEKMSAFQWIKD